MKTNKDTVIANLKKENQNTIVYHRKPTNGEIKCGYGATHYKDFTLDECWNDKKDDFKAWFICPIDKLRYYY